MDSSTASPTRIRHGVVALATLMAVLLYLDRICLSVLFRDMQPDLQLSDDDWSVLLSAFFWTYALAQVPSGWLSDRFGPRLVLALYILSWSICTGLIGLASSFAAVLWLRFGTGLAQAGAYPTGAAIVARWVPLESRGTASGIVSTGGRIGGALAPVLTAFLVLHLGSSALPGWRLTLAVYGLLGIGVAAAFWFVVRDYPQQHPGCNAQELALIEAGREPVTTAEVPPLPVGPISRDFSLWCSCVSQFFTNLGWLFLVTLFPKYLARVHALSDEEIGPLAGIPILVGMAGMLAGGWVTDVLSIRLGRKWGRRLPMAGTRFLAMGAFLSCLLWQSPWPITLALACVAVFTDLGTPAVWAYCQDVGGRHVGSILGWGNMWGNLGAAVSPIVLNAVVKGTGSWDACFLACAGAFFLSGLAALGVDSTRPIVADSPGTCFGESGA